MYRAVNTPSCPPPSPILTTTLHSPRATNWPEKTQTQKVISNYTKRLATTDPEANPIRGPPQPPSWELPEGSDFPNVSDDESESDEANNSSNAINGDKPVSLSETRKEMEERMEKKVSAFVRWRVFNRPNDNVPKREERGVTRGKNGY